jgi:hypothetical protein
VGLFTRHRNIAFDRVTSVMGETATWTPSVGGPQQTESVLFNHPTEQRTIDGGPDYDPNRFEIEYRKDLFPGLMESVNDGNTEIVSISGQDYYVRSFTAKYDGDTLIGILQPTSA